MNEVLSWILNHKVELAGTISGFIYIYLSIRASAWLWVVGFITSAAYIFVFFTSKFYADMALQVYYLVISVYGWFHWKDFEKTQHAPKPIISTSHKQHIIFAGLTLLGTLIIGFLLHRYTDSPVPYQDAFTTAASIVATYMLTEKHIENWIYWVVVDVYSAYLYVNKDLHSTAVLYIIYTIMAVIGYIQWKKKMKTECIA